VLGKQTNSSLSGVLAGGVLEKKKGGKNLLQQLQTGKGKTLELGTMNGGFTNVNLGNKAQKGGRGGGEFL